MNIYEKLSNIQNELKCNKNQFNKFGGYKYRSCEDILEAVKPICKKYETTLVLSDELRNIGDRYYIQATAILYDIEERIIDNEIKTESISNTAYAREEENKKGMDGSQITGTASSYARKYALNGLFNIDDTKDADTDEFVKQTSKITTITKTQEEALRDKIKNLGIENEVVIELLQERGYKKLSDIKIDDYTDFVNEIDKSIPMFEEGDL